MSGSTQELRVGSRVLDKDDFRGTVCYIGPVATSKSTETIYAGISWDDNTRGRNDGSVVTADGVIHRYFQCTQGAGSFVKAELVKTGTDFLSALRQRYEDDSCSGKVEESSIVGISGHSVPILLVGDEKIRAQQVNINNLSFFQVQLLTNRFFIRSYADFTKAHTCIFKQRACFSHSSEFIRINLSKCSRGGFARLSYLEMG